MLMLMLSFLTPSPASRHLAPLPAPSSDWVWRTSCSVGQAQPRGTRRICCCWWIFKRERARCTSSFCVDTQPRKLWALRLFFELRASLLSRSSRTDVSGFASQWAKDAPADWRLGALLGLGLSTLTVCLVWHPPQARVCAIAILIPSAVSAPLPGRGGTSRSDHPLLHCRTRSERRATASCPWPLSAGGSSRHANFLSTPTSALEYLM